MSELPMSQTTKRTDESVPNTGQRTINPAAAGLCLRQLNSASDLVVELSTSGTERCHTAQAAGADGRKGRGRSQTPAGVRRRAQRDPRGHGPEPCGASGCQGSAATAAVPSRSSRPPLSHLPPKPAPSSGSVLGACFTGHCLAIFIARW